MILFLASWNYGFIILVPCSMEMAVLEVLNSTIFVTLDSTFYYVIDIWGELRLIELELYWAQILRFGRVPDSNRVMFNLVSKAIILIPLYLGLSGRMVGYFIFNSFFCDSERLTTKSLRIIVERAFPFVKILLHEGVWRICSRVIWSRLHASRQILDAYVYIFNRQNWRLLIWSLVNQILSERWGVNSDSSLCASTLLWWAKFRSPGSRKIRIVPASKLIFLYNFILRMNLRHHSWKRSIFVSVFHAVWSLRETVLDLVKLLHKSFSIHGIVLMILNQFA